MESWIELRFGLSSGIPALTPTISGMFALCASFLHLKSEGDSSPKEVYRQGSPSCKLREKRVLFFPD